MNKTRLPITLLTGFLGAGKSTLLNRVLVDERSGRLAIIVNEFGDVGLDHDLIQATDEDVTLLSSGCICCSIRGDLATTIPSLLERRASGALQFDRIVIETTGLADPGPIQRTLLTDPALAGAVQLDGIITLADAVNGQRTLDAQFEAVSQVAMADLIVLTKTDLATTSAARALRKRLLGLNETARVVEVADVVASPGMLWGRSGGRWDVTAREALDWLTPKPLVEAMDPLANLSGMAATAAPQPVALPHDGRISSASLVLDRPIKRAKLSKWISNLMDQRGSDILRIKGIVFLGGEPLPYVFHGVQHTFDSPVPLEGWQAGDTTSRIVMIARDISSRRLERLLDKLRR
ncbi:putative metal chaperone [Candidatus Rhodobacter oscarellae]|uniref:Putative metal chaperone n=1 Tax=Candidatus Rhodobacter oscarellae TaxID=1675527 RepID=A0A0J9E3T2_9RHOB|nr:GTP-binding protein [Candidatus Rhodobacter lobularis]KMW57445.1 putative metal chaperone [Candidatus Rhodobacter lobularis]